MFVAFEGPPMILRLYGRGHVILPDSSEWNQLIHHFDLLPGARQIIHVHIQEVKTSCGYSVPFFSYSGERDTLQRWASQKGEKGLQAYHQEKNSISMDGIVTPLGQMFLSKY
jgi:hypothetical protein